MRIFANTVAEMATQQIVLNISASLGIGSLAGGAATGAAAGLGSWGLAAGLVGVLGLGALAGGLFGGSNAGWGFQTPEATGQWGRNPLNAADFWTAEGSDGTSLEGLSSYISELIDAVDDAIDETVDEIEGLGGMMSSSISRKFLAALDSITITLPQFGLNEENFTEMMGNVAGFVRDEMLRQAAPAIGDALAAQWGTDEWMSAIPAMSDDSAVRADYEELLGLYQRMRAEIEAYGQATVETVEDVISAAEAFNETLENATGWIKDGMAGAMKDALAEDNLVDGMAAFKSSFRQTIYDAMLSGMIEAAINSAALEPHMATFSAMLEDAFAQPTTEGMTAGVEAAVAYWDAEVQPRADRVAETLYNAVSGSSLADFLDDTAEAADSAAERIAAMRANAARVEQNRLDYMARFAERLDEVNEAVQRALHGYNELAAELADIQAQWSEYKTILEGSGHWAWAQTNDPAFLEQFQAAWDAVKQAAIDDAWGQIVEDYKDAMGTADDLSSTIADINDQWDENIETLKVMAEALGLTSEALQAWINVANTARETAIANARAEQERAVIQSQRGLAQYFPGYDQNAQTIANIAQGYGLAVETITADWIENVMKYFMGLPASGASGVAAIFGDDWEQVADDIAALGQVLKNLSDQARQVRQGMTSALSTAVDTRNYQAYLAQAPGGTRAGYLYDVLSRGQADLLSGADFQLEDLTAAASMVSQWYTQAVSEATTAAQTWAQVTESAQSMIDSIEDLITDIKYSDLNVMLPNQKALEAAADYETLRDAALAEGATTADIQAFTDFARTYLETSKAALGSGVTYQDRYQAVMDDLTAVQEGLVAGDYDQAIYNELTAQTETIHADLTDINAGLDSFMGTLNYLFTQKTGGLDLGALWGIDLGDLGTGGATEGAVEGVPGGDETVAAKTMDDLLAWLEGPFATWMDTNIAAYLGNISGAYAPGGYIANMGAYLDNINNIVNGNYASWGGGNQIDLSGVTNGLAAIADLLTNHGWQSSVGVYGIVASGFKRHGDDWYTHWLQPDLYKLLGSSGVSPSTGYENQTVSTDFGDSPLIQALEDLAAAGNGSVSIDLTDVTTGLGDIAYLLSNHGWTSTIGMNGILGNFGWWFGNLWYPRWLQADLYRLLATAYQARSQGQEIQILAQDSEIIQAIQAIQALQDGGGTIDTTVITNAIGALNGNLAAISGNTAYLAGMNAVLNHINSNLLTRQVFMPTKPRKQFWGA